MRSTAAGRWSWELADTAVLANDAFAAAGTLGLNELEHLWQSILTALDKVDELLARS